MNKQRRRKIAIIRTILVQCQTDLDALREEEESYLDTMPEALQASDKAEKAEAAIDCLEAARDTLDEAIANLEAAAE